MIKTLTIALLIFSFGCYAGTPRQLEPLIVQGAKLSWTFPANELDQVESSIIYYSADSDPTDATEIDVGNVLTWTLTGINCVDCRFWVAGMYASGVESERMPFVDADGNDLFTIITQTRPGTPIDGTIEVN